MFTTKTLTTNEVLNNVLLSAEDEHRTVYACKIGQDIHVTLTSKATGRNIHGFANTTDPAELLTIAENLPFSNARAIAKAQNRTTMMPLDFAFDAIALPHIVEADWGEDDDIIITREDGATLSIISDEYLDIEDVISQITAFAQAA